MEAVTDDFAFRYALGVTLAHEGGFVNDPADPGGATQYGISLAFLRARKLDFTGDGEVDLADVRALTPDTAAQVYRTEFWDRYGYGRLADVDVAAKVFDLAVNMGPVQAHRCLQRACRACGEHIADDGVLGPLTRDTTNSIAAARLLPALRAEAAGLYRLLVAQQPVRAKWLAGWLKRAYA